jgi:protein phosphatase methylesterase 1
MAVGGPSHINYLTTRLPLLSVITNTIRNPNSARISIPPIIASNSAAFPVYKWRTSLRSTAPYWPSALIGIIIDVNLMTIFVLRLVRGAL